MQVAALQWQPSTGLEYLQAAVQLACEMPTASASQPEQAAPQSAPATKATAASAAANSNRPAAAKGPAGGATTADVRVAQAGTPPGLWMQCRLQVSHLTPYCSWLLSKGAPASIVLCMQCHYSFSCFCSLPRIAGQLIELFHAKEHVMCTLLPNKVHSQSECCWIYLGRHCDKQILDKAASAWAYVVHHCSTDMIPHAIHE